MSANLQDVATRLRQGNVRRPVNLFLLPRKYSLREITTLAALEPDASKVLGRRLTEAERSALLEHHGRELAILSMTKTLCNHIGILGGLGFTFFTPRVRSLWRNGRYIRWTWNLGWRSYLGHYIGIQIGGLYWNYRGNAVPLTQRVLQDTRMTWFRDTLQQRRQEFGGHLPYIVRSWKSTNAAPAVQWFRDAFQHEAPMTRPPVIEHPDLHWYRAWPAESEGGSSDEDQRIADNIQAAFDPRTENPSVCVFGFSHEDLGLKPFMYI